MARGIDQHSTVQRHFAFLAYIDNPKAGFYILCWGPGLLGHRDRYPCAIPDDKSRLIDMSSNVPSAVYNHCPNH